MRVVHAGEIAASRSLELVGVGVNIDIEQGSSRTAKVTLTAEGGAGGPHDHDDRYFTELEADARFAEIVHAHEVSEIAGLQASLDAKELPASAQAKVDAHAADTTGVHGIADTAALVLTGDPRLSDARAPLDHDHDTRYFTEAEVTALLAGKQDSGNYSLVGHGHPISEITALQAALDGKADDGDLALYQALSQKGQANGYASLGADGKVPAAQLPAGGSGPASVVLAADLAASTVVALANATGLVFALAANTTYRFSFAIVFRTAALTTGIRLGFTCPAFAVLASTVRTLFAADGAGGDFQGAITASDDSVVTSAVPAINTDYVAEIEGLIRTTAAGNLQVRFATEIAGSAATIRLGSNGQLWTL